MLIAAGSPVDCAFYRTRVHCGGATPAEASSASTRPGMQKCRWKDYLLCFLTASVARVARVETVSVHILRTFVKLADLVCWMMPSKFLVGTICLYSQIKKLLNKFYWMIPLIVMMSPPGLHHPSCPYNSPAQTALWYLLRPLFNKSVLIQIKHLVNGFSFSSKARYFPIFTPRRCFFFKIE